MKIGLLIYGSLDTVTGGYIYDRHMAAHLVSQGDQVEIISLPWRNYTHHLLDNFSATLRQRLLNLEVDLLIQDELCHPSLFMINSRLRGKVEYPIIALVHHLRSSEEHPRWTRWLYRRIEKAYLNTVDGCICNSRTTLSTVDSFTPHLPPNVVAYPGADTAADFKHADWQIRRVDFRQSLFELAPNAQVQGAVIDALFRSQIVDKVILVHRCTRSNPFETGFFFQLSNCIRKSCRNA